MSASLSTMLQPKRPPILHTGPGFNASYLSRCAAVNTVKLSNGFKVSTEPRAGQLATVGLYTKSGSRYETAEKNGTAHLVSRAMWQGTKSKSAAEVRAALASFGGQLEINNGRELCSAKITCLKKDVPKALELLGDTAVNARLDDAALTAAQPGCIEAMKDYEDDIHRQVLHWAHTACYDSTDEIAGHGLGNHVHGTGINIKGGITAAEAQEFHKSVFLVPDSMALVVSGVEDEAKLQNQAEQLFGGIAQTEAPEIGKRYVGGCVRHTFHPTPPYNHHTAIGWEICGADSCDNVPLRLLLEVHGAYDRYQHDLTSNWAIRFHYSGERFFGIDGWWGGNNINSACTGITQYGGGGFYHEVHPFKFNYTDTGIMGFYYQAPDHGAVGIDSFERPWVLQREWLLYCNELDNHRVEVGKNKLKSSLLLQHDGTKRAADVIGEQVSYTGRVVPLEEQFARIDNLTTQQVSDTINHYYYDREPIISAYGNKCHMTVGALVRMNMKDITV